MRKKYATVDEYILDFPPDLQKRLKEMRKFIKSKLPKSEEKISYGIPTFTINGKYVIYFAGFKDHVSVYPAPRGVDEFKEELASYKGGKGTVQFPNNKPIPYGILERIIDYRVKLPAS